MVDGKSIEVPVKGAVSVNDAEAYVTCGLNGFGIIQPSRYMVAPHLQSGALIEVLSDWKPPPMPISVAYLQNRHLSPKVRVFVDWISELFQHCPLMSGCKEEHFNKKFTFIGEHKQKHKPVLGNSLHELIAHHNTAESVF